MTENKWDDQRIKDSLKQMPDIRDRRSKSEILARLKQDDRLQQNRNNKRLSNWIPAFVAIAALLVVSLLLPSMLRGNEKTMMDTVMEKRSMDNAKMDMSTKGASDDADAVFGKSEVETEEEAATLSLYDVGMVPYSVVYPQDIIGSTVFHLGLAGSAAESVPVTFLIPDSQIKEDFEGSEPTSFDLYEKYASRIDEEALGFTEYHPYRGKLTMNEDIITHTLPKGHGYDIGSGTIATYSHSLQDTFYGFKQIRFENEDGTVLEFDQAGEPSKPMDLRSGKNFYNYYLFEQRNGMELLSSSFAKTYDSLEEALQEMKVKPNDIYSTLIPKDINFELVEENGLGKVLFENELDLNKMDQKKALQMIEGILLTGASFGTQLQFENVVQVDWNGFDFTKPLPIPVGPNHMPFLLK